MGRVAQRVETARRPPAAELDARRAPAAHGDLPGMARAFDPAAMSGCFDRALLGSAGTITSCTVDQATYLPGRFALVRYTIEARDRVGDESSTFAFEILSLLRLALDSWQKLKVARLERVLDLLETSSRPGSGPSLVVERRSL